MKDSIVLNYISYIWLTNPFSFSTTYSTLYYPSLSCKENEQNLKVRCDVLTREREAVQTIMYVRVWSVGSV